MLDSFPRPIILAHRGDSIYAPENTLPAFSLAIEKGADGVELDVRLTADGRVVVFHDSHVERTTDGKGRISNLTLEDIRGLDAGSWFNPAFSGTKVPLLDEAFEVIGRDRLINVEMKNLTTPFDGLALKVCEVIKHHNIGDQVLLSSFLPYNLKISARALPPVSRGLLAFPSMSGVWARSFGFMFGDYQALHLHISSCSLEQILRVHRVKRRVHVWGVNSPEDVRRLRDWGVDGFITSDPATVVRVLDRV